jgi:hypothetical protein
MGFPNKQNRKIEYNFDILVLIGNRLIFQNIFQRITRVLAFLLISTSTSLTMKLFINGDIESRIFSKKLRKTEISR